MKKNILIIQSSARLKISDWLELADFNILAANDGISGLWMAKKFPIDLIISEIHLPKLNGVELLQELRKNSTTAKIPLIFLAATKDKYTQWQAQQLGVQDYLAPPLKFSQFLQAINHQSQVNFFESEQSTQVLIKDKGLLLVC